MYTRIHHYQLSVYMFQPETKLFVPGLAAAIVNRLAGDAARDLRMPLNSTEPQAVGLSCAHVRGLDI